MKIPLISAMARRIFPAKPLQTGPLYLAPPGAGIFVNEEIAMRFSAVWACVRIVSEPIGTIPWKYYQITDNGSREVTDDAIHQLLKVRPNPEMSPITFKVLMMMCTMLWGNGYAEIERRGVLGVPRALWPIHPSRVKVKRNTAGRVVYIVKESVGPDTVLPQANMFHIKGPGPDGLTGYSVVQLARESISLGLATEQHGATFFGNGAVPGFVLKTPNKFKVDEHEQFKKLWNDEFKGSTKSHKMAVLYGGMEPHMIGIPPEDSQYLETRKFQVLEIARWFRVPPHKLADLQRSTFNNIEHQSIEFVTDSLLPWVIRMEQEADYKLIPPKDTGSFFTRMKLEALQRGDSKTQHKNFAIGRQWGYYSVNDIRGMLDLNKLPGDTGDQYLVPGNMITADQVGKEPLSGQPGSNGNGNGKSNNNDDDTVKDSYRMVFREAAARMATKEVKAASRAAKKFKDDQKGFQKWVDNFYGIQQANFSEVMATPVMALVHAVGIEDGCLSDVLGTVLEVSASVYADKNSNQLMHSYTEGKVDELMRIWSDRELAELADGLLDKTMNLILVRVATKRKDDDEYQS